PSADHAHASVAYIQKEVLFGDFIRGLHHYGASTMIILAVLHLAQTFIWGAYKQRRELLWLVGVLLLLLVLAFGFTGYLLPWDQKAYFGTKVGVSIMSGVPLIGDLLERIVLGGTTLSTLTLSRFFVVHVLILPLIIIGFIVMHLFLFRRATPAGPFHSAPVSRTEPFYPKQFFKDSVFILILFAIMAVLSYFLPAPLEPQADPADTSYIARPEWYFLPLYQLLKYFPGKLALIPTVILPGLIFTALFLLPFVDRSPRRNPIQRPIATALLSVVLLASVGLIMVSRWDDRRDPLVSAQLDRQHKNMEKFLATPFTPQSVGAQLAANITPTKSVAPAPALFLEKCAVCHGEKGEGGVGSPLNQISQKPQRTRDDLIKLIKNPRAYQIDEMMPANPEFTDQQCQELADWILSLNAAGQQGK
ncbi:MAG: cytochrome b N-terminal domain-containing protein, partial [Acidobacteriota bacterium]